MIRVVSPIFISDADIMNYLLEDNFTLRFSWKHKLYYNILRPIMPVALRKKLQARVNARVQLNKNFIFDEFVNLASLEENRVLLSRLYPNRAASAIVLTHDVEEESGLKFIPRVIELEMRFNFRSSWNIVPYKYPIDVGIMNLIRESGHEIGIHGYNHDGKLYYSEKIFLERARYINEALKKYSAVGFRSPMVHRNLVWLQQLDIEYDASCFDYDPFQPFPGGVGSIWPFKAGKFIELPYTMPQDHVLFYILKEKSNTIWKNKADWIAKNHGVILMLTHPDYLKEREHLRLYEDILQYLKTFKNAWHCLPRELSTHFRSIFDSKDTN